MCAQRSRRWVCIFLPKHLICFEGLRRLLSDIDEGTKVFPGQTQTFFIQSTQPRREFFDNMIQGFSGFPLVRDAETRFTAEFTMKYVVLSVHWWEKFGHVENVPECFLYPVILKPSH